MLCRTTRMAEWKRNQLFRLCCCCIALLASVTSCGRVGPRQTIDDLITLPVDTLEALFEIGEEIGESSSIFGSILAAGIDDQGRIFVLDEIETCLKVYDLQGNYIQNVSRRGAGPGELIYPKGMFIMPDGRIGIVSSDKQGYIVFDDSLQFIEEVSLWPVNSPYHVSALSNTRLVVCRYDESTQTDFVRHTVAIYDWGKAEWDTLLWKDSMVITIDDCFNNPSIIHRYALLNRQSTASNRNGIVYFAPLDPFEYRVIGWDSSGTEVLNFTRDLTPVAKSPEEIENEIISVDSAIRTRGSRPIPGGFRPAPYRNMVINLGIGPDENLWVQRGTLTEPFFDIYDLEGNLLRHAIFPVDSWSWETEITPQGVLAWELDPPEGYQKLYLLK